MVSSAIKSFAARSCPSHVSYFGKPEEFQLENEKI